MAVSSAIAFARHRSRRVHLAEAPRHRRRDGAHLRRALPAAAEQVLRRRDLRRCRRPADPDRLAGRTLARRSTCRSWTARSTAPARSWRRDRPCCAACRPDRCAPTPARCSSASSSFSATTSGDKYSVNFQRPIPNAQRFRDTLGYLGVGSWELGVHVLLTLSWLVPLAGALLLLFIGNADGRRDGLIRWLTLGISLVAFAVTAGALGVVRRGVRQLPVRRAPSVDSRVRHRLLHRRRRHQPAARRAHRLPDADRAALVVGIDRAQGEGVLDLHARARAAHDRRLRLARPVPVLRVLGRHADPDVFPHRDLGLRPARLRRDQVHALHDGGQRADARRHPRPRVPAQHRHRQLLVRPAQALHARHRAADADVVLPGVHRRVRDQGAAVPVPHVAARCARAGADRRLGDPGRRAAEDGHLRPAALLVPAVPRGGAPTSRPGWRSSPSSASSTARWWRWCSRT